MSIKQFLLLSCCCILYTINESNGASISTATQHKTTDEQELKSSIEDIQKKFQTNNLQDRILTNKDDSSEGSDLKKYSRNLKAFDVPKEVLETSESIRKNKMLDYFGFYQPSMIPPYVNPYFSQEYYDDYNNVVDDEDDGMSRANRRKPGANSNRNSPIFYIRLPPTPYMFVPGLGYISQPPTIQPMALPQPSPLPPQLHYQMPAPINPFVNVPVNFLANGKPTNVYHWNDGSATGSFGPQYPSYLPNRPNRPTYRPKPSYLQDSKITHLKGPFAFNGRPEDIYLLQNTPYNSPFASPYNAQYQNQGFNNAAAYSNPVTAYSNMAYRNSAAYSNDIYNSPYVRPGYSPIYADPMGSYY